METKYLWDIIDKLRDELNIASDGINDLNDVLKDLQEESKEQIKDNNKEREFSIATSIKNDKLKAEIKDEKYYSKEIEKKLKAEIKKLELLSCSDDCQDNVNALIKLQAENKDLRKGCKLLKDTSHYPKEYKSEAEEYFHHVPEAKEVYFFMLSEWEIKDAERGDLCIDKNNAICVINNTERSN